jgi:hypothetical protein
MRFFHSLVCVVIGSVDNTIRNFWNAICNDHVNAEDGFLVLSSPDGTKVAWGAQYSSAEKLLVREEYKRIYGKIEEKFFHLKLAHLCGTKGIGKTMFLFWLIYKLVSSRARGSPIPSILLIVGKRSIHYLLHYNNSNPEVIYWSGQQVHFVLSDESYNLNVTPVYWSLLVSSYGATKPRDYIDAVSNQGRKGLHTVMGVLSYEEIMKLAPNSELGDFSYLIFGGSARMLSAMLNDIDCAKVVSDSHREDLIANMLDFLADSKYTYEPYGAFIKKSCDVICAHMNLYDSTPEAIKHSLFMHSIVVPDQIQGVKVVPTIASTFMRYYASFLMEQETTDALAALRMLFTTSGVGNLFERHVLKTVIEKYKTGAEFDVQRMYPSGYNRNVDDENLVNFTVRPSRKVFIRTIEDIALLVDGELGIPSITNFPLVDFVIKPHIEGQVALGKTHPSAYDRHPDLEKAMGGNVKDRKYIFFCDKSNYSAFRYDNKLLPNVKQYKMLVTWTTKRKRPDDENVG